jgi:hypothetical protein
VKFGYKNQGLYHLELKTIAAGAGILLISNTEAIK